MNECLKCKFYKESSEYFGYCRKNAPVVRTNVDDNRWPKVYPYEGCGEWAAVDLYEDEDVTSTQTDLQELDVITVRTYNFLKAANFRTVEQLIVAVDNKTILRVPGIGKVALAQIERGLLEHKAAIDQRCEP